LKRPRPEQATGLLIIAPCGEIRFTSNAATRYLKRYFGLRPNPRVLPGPLAEWAKGNPDIPFCLLQDGRFLSAQLIDRNRKGALGVLLSEHIIEESVLTAPEQLVRRWLREAKTNPEIAKILRMKPATVKKHVAHILEKLGFENRIAAALNGDGLTG
jgi:DNA-binding CsgD family transcriptional regulator